MRISNFKFQISNSSGYLLIQVLVFGAIGAMLLISLVGWAGINSRLTRSVVSREKAFQIAEAGIDYYRWHLAHDPLDFKDGTNLAGPYVHNYQDKDGNTIGQFSLTITPPALGSTIVTVQSTGKIFDGSNSSRTIEEVLGMPSLAKYAVVNNAAVRFGEGTEVFGPIHSNGGIRFDGLAHNVVTSAVASYDDPDHLGGVEYGVHTHLAPVDSLPPANVPTRADVFMAGRQFPVPAIDFNSLTTDLAQIKTAAQSAGRYFAGSGKSGYHLILKTNDTFDLYKVKKLRNVSGSCDNPGQTGWGSWSSDSEDFVGNYSFPTNGLIFLEDNVWVSGQINTARLTIASGVFPESAETETSITVNNDLLYTNYDGQDVISLIAQNNFNVGLYSEDNLEIDGAIIAKNGRAGRYYYGSSCGSDYRRNTLTLFGMIVSNGRYGFSYVDGTGYEIRHLTYDGNLLYNPPPSFPLTTDQYQVISWQEK